MAMTPSVRRAAKIALGIAATTAISLIPGVATAAPAPTATISGTVTAADTGVPLAGIGVALLQDEANGGFGGPVIGAEVVASATTSADGTYQFSDVAPSEPSGYYVCYTGGIQGPLSIYEGQCYSGAEGFSPFPDAFSQFQLPPGTTPIAVAQGQQVTNINAAMIDLNSSSIAGTVTGRGVLLGPTKLNGVTVTVTDPEGTLFGSATTNSQGSYTISGLPAVPSGYHVCFKTTALYALVYRDECYANSAWSGTGAVPASSTLVEVAPSATTTVNITLPIDVTVTL
jgi:hypothetical protein